MGYKYNNLETVCEQMLYDVVEMSETISDIISEDDVGVFEDQLDKLDEALDKVRDILGEISDDPESSDVEFD